MHTIIHVTHIRKGSSSSECCSNYSSDGDITQIFSLFVISYLDDRRFLRDLPSYDTFDAVLVKLQASVDCKFVLLDFIRGGGEGGHSIEVGIHKL